MSGRFTFISVRNDIGFDLWPYASSRRQTYGSPTLIRKKYVQTISRVYSCPALRIHDCSGASGTKSANTTGATSAIACCPESDGAAAGSDKRAGARNQSAAHTSACRKRFRRRQSFLL